MPLHPFKLRRATIPLDHDLTGRFLPYIIAILTLLASLMLLLAVGLTDTLGSWRSSLEGRATVQVLPLDTSALPLEHRVQLALEQLHASPLVAAAEPLAADKMAQLLAPWLGAGSLPDDLPVPALIDVTFKDAQTDIAPLKTALESIAGAQIDDHGTWLRHVRQLAQAGVMVCFVLLTLIGGAATLVLVLLVRAALSMHKDVVELLHLVGATDAFIARQFRNHMLRVSVLGALLGSVLAILIMQILLGMAERAGFALEVSWLWLPVVPCGFVALAAYTAQRVTCNRLAEMT